MILMYYTVIVPCGKSPVEKRQQDLRRFLPGLRYRQASLAVSLLSYLQEMQETLLAFLRCLHTTTEQIQQALAPKRLAL